MLFECSGVDYKARAYDPSLGRFIQPDTIIPSAGASQAYNRFSYVINNPINAKDPSGHCLTGVVVDTIFCIFVASLIVWAIVGGVSSGVESYQETGEVNLDKLVGDAMGGSLIAGAPSVAFVAAPTVLSTAGYGFMSAGQVSKNIPILKIASDPLTKIGINSFAASNGTSAFFIWASETLQFTGNRGRLNENAKHCK